MKKPRKKIYLQRRRRYLKKIIGSAIRPRLAVFKSHQHTYAQLIDDEKGYTLVFSSTLDKDIKASVQSTSTKEAAKKVGEKLGIRAKEKGISTVTFDRKNYPYHGKVQSIAEGARENGLNF